jgi:vacuolar-type H+-ATPase catalytic subunit A/Vma1
VGERRNAHATHNTTNQEAKIMTYSILVHDNSNGMVFHYKTSSTTSQQAAMDAYRDMGLDAISFAEVSKKKKKA